MELGKAIISRRSIRKYTLKKVSFDDIIKICEASIYAPMAGNLYSVKLILVSDKEKIYEIADACEQDFIKDSGYVVVVCTDPKKTEKSYGDYAANYLRQQAGAAIQNMLLVATNLKIGSCWVGYFNDLTIKRILSIPDNIKVEAVLSFGMSGEKLSKKRKPSTKEILFFNKWKRKTLKREKKVPA